MYLFSELPTNKTVMADAKLDTNVVRARDPIDIDDRNVLEQQFGVYASDDEDPEPTSKRSRKTRPIVIKEDGADSEYEDIDGNDVSVYSGSDHDDDRSCV